MPDVRAIFSDASAASAYPGPVPAAPTPPAVQATALPGTAPTLGLNLNSVIIIVAGDITVTTSIPNAVIQRR